MRGSVLPEGRQGRALALGLLAIVLVVAWLGLGAPLLGWYRSRAIALGEQQQLAAHMEAVAASLPAMRAAAGRARQVPAAGAVLSGASDAIDSFGGALTLHYRDWAIGTPIHATAQMRAMTRARRHAPYAHEEY